MTRFDAIIVGTGPAGLAAALNLKIRGKSFLLIGPVSLSAKLVLAPKIENYLGFPGITGADLASRFLGHLDYMGIAITPGVVSTVYPMGDRFALATASDTFEAACVILATGVFSAKHLPGEQELLGRGVGYCATCDAPLFRGKTVAILGYGDESVHEANFVAGLAETVYYLPQKASDAKLDPRIRVVNEKPFEILGERAVTGLRTENSLLPVDGVFVLRDSVAPASMVPGLETEGGFIRVDARMCTNLPGCFAAGDCTGKPHQYMRAVGQGQTAAFSAIDFLDQNQ